MGGKLSILENRTYYSIELRMWVHPARPDKFEKIIRIKPGGTTRVTAKQGLLDFDKVLVMVYANGVWTGNYIFPVHLMTYAKSHLRQKPARSCHYSRQKSIQLLQTQVLLLDLSPS